MAKSALSDRNRSCDHLKVFGKSFASGFLTADKIIASRNPSNKAWLRGPVDDVTPNRISILGFEDLATGLPQNGLSLENGGTLTVAQFIAQIPVGDIVHLKGRYNPNDISRETASLAKAE
jgi:hypothetical protein